MARSRKRRPSKTGGIVVWKPIGLSSRRALEWAQSRLGVGDLGHSGTLDPRAAGLLVLIGGEARKFQDLLSRRDKVYRARIWLGVVSGSEDSEGPLWSSWPRPGMPSSTVVTDAIDSFGSGYDQIPPKFSAVRQQGKRLHVLARRGEPMPEPKPRTVHFHSLRLVRYEPPILDLEVHCSSGTYIRSLARDLGERLGTGAYLAGLRRTAIGGVVESESRPLQSVGPDDWCSLEDILRTLPAIQISADEEGSLSHGQAVSRSIEEVGERVAWVGDRVAGLVNVGGGQIRSKRWLSNE